MVQAKKETKVKMRPGPKSRFDESMTGEARITVVVTSAQAELIKRVAEAKGKSASAWAREILLAAVPPEI